jgi:YVTN family beta-propeller protein
MGELPSGTVTFLFTDIEGSTRLLHAVGRQHYRDVLAAHHRLVREAIERNAGVVVDTQGDAFFAAFPRAIFALRAAIEAQRSLAGHDWPAEAPVRVRIGLHTGDAEVEDGRYVGLAVHRAQRITSAAHGGQTLLSATTRDFVEDDLPPNVRLADLGDYPLKDLERPERLVQLSVAGLPDEFPPPRTAAETPASFEPAQSRRSFAAVVTRPWFIGAIVAIAIAAAVPIVATLAGGGKSTPTTVAANSIGVIDPRTNELVDQIPVGGSPDGVAVGLGGVWVANTGEATLSQIDPQTRKVVRTVGVGRTPSDIATGFGYIWVTSADDQALTRIAPGSGQITDTIDLAPGSDLVGRPGLAVGEGAVWTNRAGNFARSRPWNMLRIEPSSESVAKVIRVGPGTGEVRVQNLMAAGEGAVWVSIPQDQSLTKIDASHNRPAGTVRFPGETAAVAAGAGAVWVAAGDTTIYRLDPDSLEIVRTIEVPARASAIGVGPGSVWVSSTDGSVTRIDPLSDRVVARIRVGGNPSGIAVGAGAVWVSVD